MTYPVRLLCRVMKVSHSAYYAWCKRPAKVISADELHLYRRMKALFAESRGSLGSRTLLKQLRKEGFKLGRYRVRRLMKWLKLSVIQRRAYKVTTVRKHSHRVAANLVDQHFNPKVANQVWAGDITYLRTHEGWLYLAIVMDLHSRRIIGWAMDKTLCTDLVERAMQMAITLRTPKRGLIFHSDRGSQYTSKRFSKFLKKRGFHPSMSGKGACWDNAVVERFFGSLKNEWLLNIYHLTREVMKHNITSVITTKHDYILPMGIYLPLILNCLFLMCQVALDQNILTWSRPKYQQILNKRRLSKIILNKVAELCQDFVPQWFQVLLMEYAELNQVGYLVN